MNYNKNNILPSKSKKIDFKNKKENTISSLFEVENFLTDLKKIFKYIKLYKFLK